jgi:hypothetical protein
MKTITAISVIASILLFFSAGANAAGGHGAGGGSGNKSGGGCKTTIINHIVPKHLTVVYPKSEFSFWVRGIKDPSLVEVTAKKIPVTVTSEDKETFFAFTGKLPDSLSNTAARIQVKVHSKKCPADKGWLLKIGGLN